MGVIGAYRGLYGLTEGYMGLTRGWEGCIYNVGIGGILYGEL